MTQFRFWLVILATSLIIALASDGHCADREASNLMLKNAREYWNTDRAKAIELLNKAVSLDPANPQAHEDLAWFHLGKDCLDGLYNIDQAIRLRSKTYKLLIYSRGRCLRKHRRYEEAIADFNASTVLDPLDPDGYSDRAFSYAELGHYLLAISDYDQAITLRERLSPIKIGDKYYPHSSWGDYMGRGRAYIELKEFEKSIDDFSSALRSIDDPEAITMIYFDRARAYFFTGDYEQCVSDVGELLRITQRHGLAEKRYPHGLAHHYRGVALQQMQRQEDAEVEFKKACSFGIKGSC